jgi:hypothetical protein
MAFANSPHSRQRIRFPEGDGSFTRAAIRHDCKPKFRLARKNAYWVVKAAIELKRGNTASALLILTAVGPYELAQPSPNEIGTLYPEYLRGQAYLMAHDGAAAAKEFRKIIDHPEIVVNFVTGALAHVGLARAYGLQGETDKALAAYQDFFIFGKRPTLTFLSSALPRQNTRNCSSSSRACA